MIISIIDVKSEIYGDLFFHMTDLDVDKLCSHALLQSIFAETLRLHTIKFIVRMIMKLSITPTGLSSKAKFPQLRHPHRSYKYSDQERERELHYNIKTINELRE